MAAADPAHELELVAVGSNREARELDRESVLDLPDRTALFPEYPAYRRIFAKFQNPLIVLIPAHYSGRVTKVSLNPPAMTLVPPDTGLTFSSPWTIARRVMILGSVN